MAEIIQWMHSKLHFKHHLIVVKLLPNPHLPSPNRRNSPHLRLVQQQSQHPLLGNQPSDKRLNPYLHLLVLASVKVRHKLQRSGLRHRHLGSPINNPLRPLAQQLSQLLHSSSQHPGLDNRPLDNQDLVNP
jgi:hypothetical protein